MSVEPGPVGPPFVELVDLASDRLGGAVIYANDEFFAEKDNLLKPEKPIFIEGKYTDRGKWMDGWESRRKRVAGHDWCIVRLAVPGTVYGVDIDTYNLTPYLVPGATSATTNVRSFFVKHRDTE